MNNIFLKNTDTKPGAIQTLQQNHNHKYLHVKGTKDTFVKLSKSVERLKQKALNCSLTPNKRHNDIYSEVRVRFQVDSV